VGTVTMNRQPLISVIMPAYNHEKYVQDAISSIIAQAYQSLELIIIDDGSSDTTWQKICGMENACKARFLHIDFSTQENADTRITLNRLIEKTSGEYLFIIASDDMAAPEAIKIEFEFLSRNPDYALVVGANDIIDADGQKCYWDKKKNNVYEKKDAIWLSFSDYLMYSHPKLNFFSEDFGNYKNLLYHGNYIPNGYLIRKSIFNYIDKFSEAAPLEDYFLMLQISKFSKMKFLSDILYHYRWHGGNTILKNDRHLFGLYTQVNEILNICPNVYDFIKYLQETIKYLEETILTQKEEFQKIKDLHPYRHDCFLLKPMRRLKQWLMRQN
jgi:alpha-1,3-rhamnosyltransferase